MGFYWSAGSEEDREELRAFAMACATLGIPLLKVPFSDREGIGQDGKKFRRLTWFLESNSPDNLYSCNQLFAQWNDAAWRTENPDHPLTMMRTFWENWKAARSKEPDYAEWEFCRGKNVLSVPKSYSKEQISKALDRLKPSK
jgi:hypothetical protein